MTGCAQAGNAGSNDTDTSAQANMYQCDAARTAYPGDADVLEGEGSGSNPMGAALGFCCPSGMSHGLLLVHCMRH